MTRKLEDALADKNRKEKGKTEQNICINYNFWKILEKCGVCNEYMVVDSGERGSML